jgi:hypothetical protein
MFAAIIVLSALAVAALLAGANRVNTLALQRRANGHKAWWNKPLTPGPMHDAEKAEKERRDRAESYGR